MSIVFNVPVRYAKATSTSPASDPTFSLSLSLSSSGSMLPCMFAFVVSKIDIFFSLSSPCILPRQSASSPLWYQLLDDDRRHCITVKTEIVGGKEAGK